MPSPREPGPGAAQPTESAKDSGHYRVGQISLSKICNLLLQAVRECENELGDLLNPKKDNRVSEDAVRKKFYAKYPGTDEAKRRGFRRAVAEAIKNNLVKSERGELWLV